jgi:hypothetical protein
MEKIIGRVTKFSVEISVSNSRGVLQGAIMTPLTPLTPSHEDAFASIIDHNDYT